MKCRVSVLKNHVLNHFNGIFYFCVLYSVHELLKRRLLNEGCVILCCIDLAILQCFLLA